MDKTIAAFFGELSQEVSINRSRQMGIDCAFNGPNETNCNFKLFATKEHTEAWQEGRREAKAAKSLYEGKEWPESEQKEVV